MLMLESFNIWFYFYSLWEIFYFIIRYKIEKGQKLEPIEEVTVEVIVVEQIFVLLQPLINCSNWVL